MFDFCYSLLFNAFENTTDYVGECHVRQFNNNSFCNNAKTFDELIERVEREDDHPRGEVGNQHGLPMVKDQSSAEQQTIEKKLLKRFALNVIYHFPCLKKAILALVLEGVTSQPRAKVMTPAAKT